MAGILGIPILGDVIGGVRDIISEVVIDKDKRIEIEYKLKELEDKALERAHEANMAQVEVNKVEASHKSLFVAGWRPFVGWVGGFGFGYATLIQPFLSWVARVSGYTGDFPDFDTNLLIAILGGLLGLGGMRTLETVKGVAREAIPPKPVETTIVETTKEETKVVKAKKVRPHFKV